MPTFKQNVKEGFALSLGSAAAFVLYMVVALVFMIPGVLMVGSELKKKKADRSTTKQVIGFTLAFIGVAIGLGMAAGVIIEMLGEAVFGD